MGPIYQKKAVERLESPDQLDRMIFVTSPMTWMLIAGFAVILSAFLAWTFLGTIRQSITVNGMVTEDVSMLAYVPLDGLKHRGLNGFCLVTICIPSSDFSIPSLTVFILIIRRFGRMTAIGAASSG